MLMIFYCYNKKSIYIIKEWLNASLMAQTYRFGDVRLMLMSFQTLSQYHAYADSV